ncbi:unnamed protein product [Dibothriocephalus latus]|uniref:Uncharacterized protein n=1 Tax=Dibothriocephalus latus TaxID=60516 RepID=A0A3P6TJN5_DIBLA|nr:unnamed protein product [Dibothriocephalus latus]
MRHPSDELQFYGDEHFISPSCFRTPMTTALTTDVKLPDAPLSSPADTIIPTAAPTLIATPTTKDTTSKLSPPPPKHQLLPRPPSP